MKSFLQIALYLLFILTISCNGSKEEEVTKDDGPDSDKDRNMFGMYIQRGLTITSDDLMDGYLMQAVPNSSSVYLINREGQVVHEWKGNYWVMGAYLQDDGSLFQNVGDPDFPVFAGGGETGRLQHITWESKILWDYESSNEEWHTHHDFAVMPNGNILSIAWEAKSAEEAEQAGRKPELIPKAGVWPDKVIEIKPNGKRGGEIVWEWHSWDHLIQDHDPSKDNYGNPSEHPELIDINKSRTRMPKPISQDSIDKLHKEHKLFRNVTADNRGSDIHHLNAINYNEDLDQIVLSSPTMDEIFIIDHSTTVSEAAGHTGGRWGKGGDILYRWGNPENYGRGDSTDHKLYGQHDVKWIKKGYPGEGNLIVFNNDVPMGPDSLDYSAVYEWKPLTDEKGNYVLNEKNRFGPEEPSWVYTAPDTVSFYSSFISGVHRMSNGNTLVTEGGQGKIL